MGLMQSVATTEGRLLAFGLFGSASKGIEPSTKKTQGQDIIIMPVDSSGHSEAAFECKFSRSSQQRVPGEV